MHITYHIGKHDGGWGYKLDDVWSESFPTHDAALAAAKRAARRQQIEGRDAEILYQTEDGTWHQEHVRAGDRPEADVLDG
ncbi:hypothetical protein CWR43_32600 [Rhizobium sullae]|uniref:DUF2188 domain-containing protein n=1 Tax=Rhizobium sullae TaxID=50338 RepID=A0A2N0D067_RHISU|nr:DUF2188 domain-containing protein [Rhizobium sullae]PKA39514.1 hypothetical protein CWR43_32600 [Rhizobium sullae]